MRNGWKISELSYLMEINGLRAPGRVRARTRARMWVWHVWHVWHEVSK